MRMSGPVFAENRIDGQLRCPKCGGSLLEAIPGPTFVAYLVAGLLCFVVGALVTVPLYFLRLATQGDEEREWQASGHRCRLCGNAWKQRPGESLSMTLDVEEIEKGQERLRQQRERDRRQQDEAMRALWYWDQTHKKN